MSKERDIAIAKAKRQMRELMSAIYQSRRQNWQPAPPDPGVIPGGIRTRAWQAAINRQKEPVNEANRKDPTDI